MSCVVIVGAQWGDEGKGKVTDYLASRADVVVRYQGGNNAGHTVVIGSQEFRLHLIPSGIFYPDKVCIIGNGLVVDPEVLFQELDGLLARGVKNGRLCISDRAHILLPCHKRLDEAQEDARGNQKIGTTRRGIGPAYVDKVSRVGLRTGELLEPGWEDYVSQLVEQKNAVFEKLYGVPGFDPAEIVVWLKPYAERMRPFITDTSLLLSRYLAEGRHVLFEGAQGTLLDLDHGTYPFVTASSPAAGGACTGSGVGPTAIDRVLGVCKAYLTRVGEGPFPTELMGVDCEDLRQRGMEFGTTTGRPRRCGWLDLVMLRYAARINGLSGLIITKLDVLDHMPKVRLCTAYRRGGEVLKEFPASLRVLRECEPVYEELDGWQQDTSGIRRYEDLPEAARRYLQRISEITGVPVVMVSVGPDREQTIVLQEVF
ncbi:MAG TPA: adenylosuccinate synthase [Syntrophomonadaceae bacterium]|nr:adenylosuccinate synthase [Syntrophomonadaceae bacterium]